MTRPAADIMTNSVPVHPVGGRGSYASTLGLDDIDSVLADIGAYDVVRLAVPTRSGIAGESAAAVPGRLEVVDHTLDRTFRIRIAVDSDLDGAVDRLLAVPSVEVAEPNRYRETVVVPNDPRFGQQWGLATINAPAAWDISTGSPSVVVAVVDTGADLNHPDLASLLVPGTDMVDLGASPVPPTGFRFEGDFAGRDATPDDEVGHGTHVAGTISSVSNNTSGVAGVTWNCRVMPIKALTRLVRISDGQVRGVGSSADIAAAIRYAADNSASVINLSLGSDAPTTVEANAVAYAVSKGVVVVAAMGNAGPAAGPSYPAAYPDVISVGAIDSADHLASFSQTGSHIDVVAPGVDIVSTYWDDGYASLSGTSMASPHVAGVAALIRSVDPSLTAAQVGDILRASARALRDNPGDPVPNNRFGAGCVDARAAVERARPPMLPSTVIRQECFPHLPRTLTVNCPPRWPVSLTWRQCIPHTLVDCPQPPTTWQPPTTIPPTLPPTLPPTTNPPTTPWVAPGPVQGAGQAEVPGTYDPYGLTETEGGDSPVFQPDRWPRSLTWWSCLPEVIRTVNWAQCPPKTIFERECIPIPTPPIPPREPWRNWWEGAGPPGMPARTMQFGEQSTESTGSGADLPTSLNCVPQLLPRTANWICPPPTTSFLNCPPPRSFYSWSCPPKTVSWNTCPVLHSVHWQQCFPRTIVEPECIPIPTPPVPTQGPGPLNPGGQFGPAAGFGGYEPYGRNPFGG